MKKKRFTRKKTRTEKKTKHKRTKWMSRIPPKKIPTWTGTMAQKKMTAQKNQQRYFLRLYTHTNSFNHYGHPTSSTTFLIQNLPPKIDDQANRTFSSQFNCSLNGIYQYWRCRNNRCFELNHLRHWESIVYTCHSGRLIDGNWIERVCETNRATRTHSNTHTHKRNV